jgi:hypothetical protein
MKKLISTKHKLTHVQRGPCQQRRHHMLRFRLYSGVCGADLHHHPRRRVGLHAPVVVRVCGFHGWSSWLGTTSPGSGAVTVSSQSRAALLTRPPVSRMNGMTLSWSAYHGTRTIPLVPWYGTYLLCHNFLIEKEQWQILHQFPPARFRFRFSASSAW